MVSALINALLNFGVVDQPDPFTGPHLSRFVVSQTDAPKFLATALILLGCLSALSRTVDLLKLLLSSVYRLVFGETKPRPRSVSRLFLVRSMGFILLLPLLASSVYSIWLVVADSHPEVTRIERITVQSVRFALYGRDAVYPYGGSVRRFDPAEGRIKGLMHALYADVQCLASRNDICMLGDKRSMGRLAKFIMSNDSASISERSVSLASFIFKTVTEQYANVSTFWTLVRCALALGRSIMTDISSLFEVLWFMTVTNDSTVFNSSTMVTGTRALLGGGLNPIRFVSSKLVQCAYLARPHLVEALNSIIGATTTASVYVVATAQSILPAVHHRMLSAASVSPNLVTRGLWSDILKSLFMVTGMLMAIAYRHYRKGTLKHLISLLEPENVSIIIRLIQERNELFDERNALLNERNRLVNKRNALSRKYDDLNDERNALLDKCDQLQCLLSEARSAHCKAAVDNTNLTSKIRDVARKLARASDDMIVLVKESKAKMTSLNWEMEEAKLQQKKTSILNKIAHSKAVSLARKHKTQRKRLVAKRKTIHSLYLAIMSSTYEAETSAIQATNLVADNKLLKDAFGLLYSGAFSYMPEEELFRIESFIMASIELRASDEICNPPEPSSSSHSDTSTGVNVSTDDNTLADSSCQLKSVSSTATPSIDTLSPPPRAPASPLLQQPPEILDSPLPFLEGTPVPWHPSMVPETHTPSMIPRYVLRGACTSTPIHVFKGPIKSRVTDSTRKRLAKSRAQEDKENNPLCSV